MVKQNRIVFFDRDGVITKPRIINRKSFAVNDFSKVKIYADVRWILDALSVYKFRIVVVTNQPDSYQNKEKEIEINKIHYYLMENFSIDCILFCPHVPYQNCNCRKPKPLMINQALEIFEANRKSSWIIGDRNTDIVAGKSAGLKTIKLNRGWNFVESINTSSDYECRNLFQAGRVIIKHS